MSILKKKIKVFPSQYYNKLLINLKYAKYGTLVQYLSTQKL